MTRRTLVDFSKHVVTEIKEDHAKIWKFADPETNQYAITFINSCGILAITEESVLYVELAMT